MGNGETTRPSCLSVSTEASPNMEESRSSSGSSGGGITAKSHRTQSFPSNSNLMGHPHHHHRPFLSSPNGADDDEDHGGGRGGSGSGPSQNDSGPNEVERSTTPTPKPKPPNYSCCYHSSSTGPSSSSTTTSTSTGISFPDHVVLVANNGGATAGLAAAATTLQPFESPRSITNTASKSPGGGGGVGMAAASAALGFPFTAAQWKELERQAMIYKYMIASVPVPSDLFLPADPTTASSVLLGGSHGGGGSVYNLRYGNRDLEPGRCKRTDGKKWRCSRDVAPHQKYCERHMHRGRPRSRKPVEQLQSSSISPDNPNSNNINKKSRLHHTPLHPNPSIGQPNNHSSPQFLGTGTIQQPKDPQLLDASIAHNSIFASSYKESNRVFGWAVDGEVAAANQVEQESLHLMDTKRREGLAPIQDYIYGTNTSTLQQGYGEEEPLNLFSYPTEIAYPGGVHSRNDEYHMFLNSDLIASKQPQIDQHCSSRGYIDAWSNGDLETIDESSVPSSKGNDLSLSSLTLSMAMVAGNALDEGMGLAADCDPRVPKDCPVSWLPFTSGGPLAEVLQLNSVACGSNPASPCASNGDSVSLPATTVSSPTRIFHKALFSQSDGSVCNSPTLAASAAPPEFVAFQWLD